MAGAYLEIFPGDSYTFKSNVLLDDVAQDLTGSFLWFAAYSARDENSDPSPFINLDSNSANVAISNGVSSNIASLVTITLPKELTANLNYVNSGGWSLVATTTDGKTYTLDRGRIAVVPRVGYSFL